MATFCNFFTFTDGSSWRAYVAQSIAGRATPEALEWLEKQYGDGNIREVSGVILVRVRTIRGKFDPRPATQTTSRVAFEVISLWLDARAPNEAERAALRAEGYSPDVSRTAMHISKKWSIGRPRGAARMCARNLSREFADMM